MNKFLKLTKYCRIHVYTTDGEINIELVLNYTYRTVNIQY